MKGLRLFILFVVIFAVGFAAAYYWQAARSTKSSEPAPPAEETAAPQQAAQAVPSSPSPAASSSAPATRAPARTSPAEAAARSSAAPSREAAPAPATPAPAPASRTTQPAAPAPRQFQVAAGTEIVFALSDALSTKTNQPGDGFSGVVKLPVQVNDTVVIPEGSLVRGTVAYVARAGRVKGRAELGLQFEKLELPDGRTYELAATLTQLGEEEKESVSKEGQVEGEGSKKRDTVTVGVATGVGAVIGAIAGGKKGAGAGAAAGAGAGAAAVLLTRGKDVELAPGAELAIKLDRPLLVEKK